MGNVRTEEEETLLLGDGKHGFSSDRYEEALQSEEVQWATLSEIFGWEWKNLWRLSAPSIVIQVSNLLLGFVTSMYVGRLGTLALAGASITGMGVQSATYGIVYGMTSALQTVCGQAYGAKEYKTMGLMLHKSLILHLIAASILGSLAWNSGAFLKFIGQSEEISSVGQLYARGLVPQIFAISVYIPMQRFLQSQNIVNPVAYISVAVLFFHMIISYIACLVFEFEILGASLTLSISCWGLAIVTSIYVIYSPSCKETWSRFSMEAFRDLWSYTKLTIASILMLAVEMWYMPTVSILAGYLSNPEISLDTMSVSLNYLTWDFMIMLALSTAASVRVGNELGSGHANLAKFSVIVVLSTTFTLSIITACLFLLLRDLLCKPFTNDADLIYQVTKLLPLLAISVVLNGVQQPLVSGVIVGCGKQYIVAYLNIIAYYLIGLPIGCFLGFKTSLGVSGLWWGMISGVFVQTTVIMIITTRINWKNEVISATERLEKASEQTLDKEYFFLPSTQ